MIWSTLLTVYLVGVFGFLVYFSPWGLRLALPAALRWPALVLERVYVELDDARAFRRWRSKHGRE